VLDEDEYADSLLDQAEAFSMTKKEQAGSLAYESDGRCAQFEGSTLKHFGGMCLVGQCTSVGMWRGGLCSWRDALLGPQRAYSIFLLLHLPHYVFLLLPLHYSMSPFLVLQEALFKK
jgi:hypothetical protein